MDQDQIKARRMKLHRILSSIIGTDKKVYFQPPESIKLLYPCIIYREDYIDARYADNIPYLRQKRYSVTVIDRDPDSVIVEQISELPACRFERSFTSDNLYHTVFNISY